MPFEAGRLEDGVGRAISRAGEEEYLLNGSLEIGETGALVSKSSYSSSSGLAAGALRSAVSSKANISSSSSAGVGANLVSSFFISAA